MAGFVVAPVAGDPHANVSMPALMTTGACLGADPFVAAARGVSVAVILYWAKLALAAVTMATATKEATAAFKGRGSLIIGRLSPRRSYDAVACAIVNWTGQ